MMNSLVETTKHLTIETASVAPELSSADENQHDLTKQIQNYQQIPLTVPSMMWLPTMIDIGSIAKYDAGFVNRWTIDYSSLIKWFGSAFWDRVYRFTRMHFKFSIVIRASWNTTGLLGLLWTPEKGHLSNESGTTECETVSTIWYASPTYRAISRIGPDTRLTVDIPWISPYSSFEDRFDTGTVPEDRWQAPNSSYDLNMINVELAHLTQIRTIATDSISYDYIVYLEPIDVTVGGLDATPNGYHV